MIGGCGVGVERGINSWFMDSRVEEGEKSARTNGLRHNEDFGEEDKWR